MLQTRETSMSGYADEATVEHILSGNDELTGELEGEFSWLHHSQNIQPLENAP